MWMYHEVSLTTLANCEIRQINHKVNFIILVIILILLSKLSAEAKTYYLQIKAIKKVKHKIIIHIILLIIIRFSSKTVSKPMLQS